MIFFIQIEMLNDGGYLVYSNSGGQEELKAWGSRPEAEKWAREKMEKWFGGNR